MIPFPAQKKNFKNDAWSIKVQKDNRTLQSSSQAYLHTYTMAGQSDLQTAILSILNVFNKYAKQEGSKDKLSQSELKKLIEAELSTGPLSKKVDSSKVDELFKEMDKNNDGQVNLCEFCKFVSILTVGYHKSQCHK
ncbi:protein S100-A1-like [Polypterus senegalus]|uniref:protein S100-A1-like n=1 Tax=Polypterus senegalus TaxID=55291 RepID=UPI001965349B|nr:protein S100-A1-like [Polypterus senegalus]